MFQEDAGIVKGMTYQQPSDPRYSSASQDEATISIHFPPPPPLKRPQLVTMQAPADPTEPCSVLATTVSRAVISTSGPWPFRWPLRTLSLARSSQHFSQCLKHVPPPRLTCHASDVLALITSPNVYLNNGPNPLRVGAQLDPRTVRAGENVVIAGLGAAVVVAPGAVRCLRLHQTVQMAAAVLRCPLLALLQRT